MTTTRWLGRRHRALVAAAIAVAVVVVVVAAAAAAAAADRAVPPDRRYRSVNVDGHWGGCYRVYYSPPANLAQLLSDDRGHEPFVIVYRPPAQPVLTDAGLTERHIEMFLADGKILGSTIDLAAHGDRSFYRQPIKAIAMVVVYGPVNEPPEGLPAKSFQVKGQCPQIPPIAADRPAEPPTASPPPGPNPRLTQDKEVEK